MVIKHCYRLYTAGRECPIMVPSMSINKSLTVLCRYSDGWFLLRRLNTAIVIDTQQLDVSRRIRIPCSAQI